jgi:hypothetical protein
LTLWSLDAQPVMPKPEASKISPAISNKLFLRMDILIIFIIFSPLYNSYFVALLYLNQSFFAKCFIPFIAHAQLTELLKKKPDYNKGKQSKLLNDEK